MNATQMSIRVGERGFTLTDLLAVIASLLIIAALLAPGVARLSRHARVTELMDQGRNLYIARLAEQPVPLPTGGDVAAVPSPSSTSKYATSTDYFIAMRARGTLGDVGLSIFAAPGVPPATNGILTAANNAWKVTLDVKDSSPSVLPVLFTRNIATPGNRLDPANRHTLIATEAPFGLAQAMAIQYAGSTLKLTPDTMNLFNPSGASNGVLVP